jgi:hypothetical protein
MERLPLHLLTDAERRGAQLALAHVKALSDRMDRNAAGRGPHAMTRADKERLAIAARAVRNAANIVRRDLWGDLKTHDVQQAYERD